VKSNPNNKGKAQSSTSKCQKQEFMYATFYTFNNKTVPSIHMIFSTRQPSFQLSDTKNKCWWHVGPIFPESPTDWSSFTFLKATQMFLMLLCPPNCCGPVIFFTIPITSAFYSGWFGDSSIPVSSQSRGCLQSHSTSGKTFSHFEGCSSDFFSH